MLYAAHYVGVSVRAKLSDTGRAPMDSYGDGQGRVHQTRGRVFQVSVKKK